MDNLLGVNFKDCFYIIIDSNDFGSSRVSVKMRKKSKLVTYVPRENRIYSGYDMLMKIDERYRKYAFIYKDRGRYYLINTYFIEECLRGADYSLIILFRGISNLAIPYMGEEDWNRLSQLITVQKLYAINEISIVADKKIESLRDVRMVVKEGVRGYKVCTRYGDYHSDNINVSAMNIISYSLEDYFHISTIIVKVLCRDDMVYYINSDKYRVIRDGNNCIVEKKRDGSTFILENVYDIRGKVIGFYEEGYPY